MDTMERVKGLFARLSEAIPNEEKIVGEFKVPVHVTQGPETILESTVRVQLDETGVSIPQENLQLQRLKEELDNALK